MADPLLGFTLAQQGVNLAPSSTTLASLVQQAVSKPTVFQENIGGSGTGAPLLRYPLKRIDASSDYLEIKVLEYIPGGATLSSQAGTLSIGNASSNISTNQKPLAYIQLPVPQNITDNQSVDWGDDSLDPYSAFVFAKTNEIIGSSGIDQIPGILENALKTAQNTFTTAGGQSLLRSKMAAAAVSGIGANVSLEGVLARTTGQVINPNLELLFKGPNIRTFPFVFEFAPREPAESAAVKKIIWTLKRHMVTKRVSGGLFIKTPDIFQLTYKTGSKAHPFLNKFKPAALLNMDVNYTGSGTYATYNDATPVHITMSLVFKELNPIYFDEYTSSDQNVGY